MFRSTLQICCLNAELTTASIWTVRAALLLANAIQCKQGRHHILPMDDHTVLEIHTQLVASLVLSLVGKPRACVHSQAGAWAWPCLHGEGWAVEGGCQHYTKAELVSRTAQCVWVHLLNYLNLKLLSQGCTKFCHQHQGHNSLGVTLQHVAAKSRRMFEQLTLFLESNLLKKKILTFRPTWLYDENN